MENIKEIYVWFKINPDVEEYLGEDWLAEFNYFFPEGVVVSEGKENLYGTGYGTGENYIKCKNPRSFYEFLNFVNDNRETLKVIEIICLDKEIENITYIENKKYAEYLDMNSVAGIKLVSKYLAKDKSSLLDLYKVDEVLELKKIIKVNEETYNEFIDFIESLNEI